MQLRRDVVSLALMVVVLAGCGGAAEEATQDGPATSAPAGASTAAGPATPSAPSDDATSEGAAVTAATGPAVISTVQVDGYGRLLADGDDRTLYVFLADTDGRSTCDDACADNWPPVLTDGETTAGGRVDAALLGSVDRDDGTVQVTYDDQPLYRYSGDSAPGDILGYGSGDVWYPVAPDGQAIDTAEDRDDADDGY
jgi:predicted lipoprotein with Yx(FWY)xxD motif